MLAKTSSVAIIGTDASLVEVEVHVPRAGLPGLSTVGLPARSVRESEHRIKAALVSSSLKWPSGRVTANLAPGALRKEGTHFDLAIAVAILAADEQVPAEAVGEWVVMGELALDGAVRPVRGVLAAALACRDEGRRGLVCPAANAAEATLVQGIEVVPVSTVIECKGLLEGQWEPPSIEAVHPEPPAMTEDLTDVRGHEQAKQALEIAAAGGHHLLFVGPPGSGKTMLARRLATVLPHMSSEEALEVTRIHSVAGLVPEKVALVDRRPFRVPHHHISLAGLVGGGSGLARPGEISLAHHGTLFLDEIGLYSAHVLDSLRTPLEEGVIRIARSGGVISYPCRFSLVGAMNPCPCGYEGDALRACRCSDQQRSNYQARLSGPLLDRFDLQVGVARARRKELMSEPVGESSEVVRARVERARTIQRRRYSSSFLTNGSVPSRLLKQKLDLTSEAKTEVGDAIDALALSGRGLDRVLRVARTIADLAGAEPVEAAHIHLALHFRNESSSGRAVA